MITTGNLDIATGLVSFTAAKAVFKLAATVRTCPQLPTNILLLTSVSICSKLYSPWWRSHIRCKSPDDLHKLWPTISTGEVSYNLCGSWIHRSVPCFTLTWGLTLLAWISSWTVKVRAGACRPIGALLHCQCKGFHLRELDPSGCILVSQTNWNKNSLHTKHSPKFGVFDTLMGASSVELVTRSTSGMCVIYDSTIVLILVCNRRSQPIPVVREVHWSGRELLRVLLVPLAGRNLPQISQEA